MSKQNQIGQHFHLGNPLNDPACRFLTAEFIEETGSSVSESISIDRFFVSKVRECLEDVWQAYNDYLIVSYGLNPLPADHVAALRVWQLVRKCKALAAGRVTALAADWPRIDSALRLLAILPRPHRKTAERRYTQLPKLVSEIERFVEPRLQ